MTWINVKDQLPELEVPVLIVECGQIMVAQLENYGPEKELLGWFCAYCCSHDIGNNVIYWRELPIIPNEVIE